MKQVIITGANGFLGNKLARAIAHSGIKVLAVDISNNFLQNIDLITFHPCDLENLDLFHDFIHINADTLFHLAWIGINADARQNYNIQLRNINVLMNVLELAKRLNIPKVIVLGSASEYAAGKMPITGDNLPAPIDAYGAVKSACHILSNGWSIQNGIPITWVIPSSVYGPGRDDNNVLTYAIKSLLKNERPEFTALEQKWDYIYIDDFIQALVLIGQNGKPGRSYTIGYGRSRQLKDYICTIRDVINPVLPLGIGNIPYKSGMPDNSEIDISILHDDTGFTPVVSFEKGIEETINYFRKLGFEK
jgi:nucleoside-diphosphate-sugar epimerase